MKRLVMKITTVVSLALAVVAAPSAATAATIFDHTGMKGDRYSARDVVHVGAMSDRASSFSTGGTCTNFYDDQNYRGYSFRSCASSVSLVGYRTGGMGATIDWNDRITSFRRA